MVAGEAAARDSVAGDIARDRATDIARAVVGESAVGNGYGAIKGGHFASDRATIIARAVVGESAVGNGYVAGTDVEDRAANAALVIGECAVGDGKVATIIIDRAASARIVAGERAVRDSNGITHDRASKSTQLAGEAYDIAYAIA